MAKKAKKYIRAGVVPTSLTLDIANALISKIYEGEALFPKGKDLEVVLPSGEKQVLAQGTVNSWITRRTIVPSTNDSLKDLLDKAREDVRSLRREQFKRAVVDTAETKLGRILKLRTSEVRRNMFGQIQKNEDGSIARKENPALLKTQADMVKFSLERLEPQTYGKLDRSENKHLVFSLADLRREEQRQNEAAENSPQ